MKQLDLKKLEGRWYKYKGFELLIRPMPASATPFRIDGTTTMGEYSFGTFNACVTNWKDLKDADNNVIECNEENKRVIFDNIDGIGAFVDKTQEKLRKDFNKEVKN